MFVVSHIQRIGCQPEKTTVHGGQSRSWSAEQGKKEKSLAARPPSPPPACCSFGEKKITRRIHLSRRYEGRRYAGGLGPSRVRTRIPTTRRLGQWVSLRKILRFRVRLQLSQSRCLSLLLAMSMYYWCEIQYLCILEIIFRRAFDVRASVVPNVL